MDVLEASSMDFFIYQSIQYLPISEWMSQSYSESAMLPARREPLTMHLILLNRHSKVQHQQMMLHLDPTEEFFRNTLFNDISISCPVQPESVKGAV